MGDKSRSNAAKAVSEGSLLERRRTHQRASCARSWHPTTWSLGNSVIECRTVVGSVRSLTLIRGSSVLSPCQTQHQTHRHIGAHSHQSNTKLGDSSNGHLDGTSSLRGRRAESEAEGLRDGLEADEGSGGGGVLKSGEGQRREGVVGERICQSSQLVVPRSGSWWRKDEPSAKTSEVTALTRTSMLPVRASIPLRHASRSPSRPLGARR